MAGAISGTPTGQPVQPGGGALAALNQALPGFGNLGTGVVGDIGQMVNGLPSPDLSRLSNAYYGTSSGVPGSEFINNRGFDLYRTNANQAQGQGINDYLALLSGASGTLSPTAGQQLQNQQFGQSLAAQEQQNQAQNALTAQGQELSFLGSQLGLLSGLLPNTSLSAISGGLPNFNLSFPSIPQLT